MFSMFYTPQLTDSWLQIKFPAKYLDSNFCKPIRFVKAIWKSVINIEFELIFSSSDNIQLEWSLVTPDRFFKCNRLNILQHNSSLTV